MCLHKNIVHFAKLIRIVPDREYDNEHNFTSKTGQAFLLKGNLILILTNLLNSGASYLSLEYVGDKDLPLFCRRRPFLT